MERRLGLDGAGEGGCFEVGENGLFGRGDPGWPGLDIGRREGWGWIAMSRGSFFYPDSLVWVRLAAGGEGVWIQDCRIRPAQNLHGKQGLGRGLGARGETKSYEDFEVFGALEVFGAWEGLGG